VRKLDIGSKHFTRVVVGDNPGQGGACHNYYISRVQQREDESDLSIGELGYVFFQNGPVAENGINGCHQEDLLAIVIDRLRHFQAGPFACRENALALAKIEEAMHWLNHRTADRQAQGVEGTGKHRKIQPKQ